MAALVEERSLEAGHQVYATIFKRRHIQRKHSEKAVTHCPEHSARIFLSWLKEYEALSLSEGSDSDTVVLIPFDAPTRVIPGRRYYATCGQLLRPAQYHNR